MSYESLGRGLEIVVHQRKQAEPGAEHQHTFQCFEHRNNTYAASDIGRRNHGERGIGGGPVMAHGVSPRARHSRAASVGRSKQGTWSPGSAAGESDSPA